jgi:LemA protein
MKKALIIIGVLLVLILMYGWGTYNRMVAANEAVEGQWAQVETQYQRRFDLIPNLVGAVKGIMEQEQEVFANITEARTKYAGAGTVNEKAAAAGEVESALGRLLVVMENYPDLKSAENVMNLQAQLEGTENRISVERKRFNDSVRDFNVMIKRVPAKWFASLYGFETKNFFEISDGVENAPQVNF